MSKVLTTEEHPLLTVVVLMTRQQTANPLLRLPLSKKDAIINSNAHTLSIASNLEIRAGVSRNIWK